MSNVYGSVTSRIATIGQSYLDANQESIKTRRDPARFGKTMALADARPFPPPRYPDDEVPVQTDLTLLLHRLLLSDRFVLMSFHFREFPALLKTFGPGGTITLLESGALSIVTDWYTFAHDRREPLFVLIQAQSDLVEV
jgi:hypothetical protein